jgi:hypothetical protein
VKELDRESPPSTTSARKSAAPARKRACPKAELGQVTGHERSYVSKVETGDIDAAEIFAIGCDRAFPGKMGWFTRFWLDSHKWHSIYPVWFHDWVEKFEREAVALRLWEHSLIPGLLQTEEYARAVLASFRRHDAKTVEDNVAARLARQHILDRENPPDLRVVLNEVVLYHEVGSPEVMHRQLTHLLEIARRLTVCVQVIPTSAQVYAGFAGGFGVATLPDGSMGAHWNTGIQGMTLTDAKLAAQTAQMFEDLRDEALTRRRSHEVIAEAAEHWTQQLARADGAHPATPTPTGEPV